MDVSRGRKRARETEKDCLRREIKEEMPKLRGEAGCLHEVYASKGGRYRRVMNLHVQDITLKRIGNAAAVEVDCAFAGCPQLLWWNGNRFVKR